MHEKKENQEKKTPMVTEKYALETISKFLPLEWPNALESDIVITPLTGGYVNTLYVVENNTVTGKKEPRKVLLRLYGGKIIGNKHEMKSQMPMNSEVVEAIIFQNQSRTGFGPKLYGVIPGGRIEEYIPSHTLTHEEASRPEFIKDLARNYVHFHLQQLPLEKNVFQNLFEIHPFHTDLLNHPSLKGIDLSSTMSLDREKEMKFIKKLIQKVNSKQVLLHFDCHFLNVLTREGEIPHEMLRTVLVDYEISIYGPRMYDIGAHFVCRTLDASGTDSKESGYPFPPENQRRLFVREYLKELKEKDPDNFDPEVDNEDHLFLESEVGTLCYSFLITNALLPILDKFIADPILLTFPEILTNFYNKRKGEVTALFPGLH